MRFAPTSNLACRVDVCRAVPFDERYPLAAGEDRDWCERLTGAGHALVFEPSALVRHHQVLSPAGFWRQQVRYGRGGHRFHTDARRRRGGPGRAPRLQSPGFYAGLLRRGFAGGPRAGVLVGVAQVATAWGMGLEAAGSITSARRRSPEA
jgi:GT2 family glycosyltransferase